MFPVFNVCVICLQSGLRGIAMATSWSFTANFPPKGRNSYAEYHRSNPLNYERWRQSKALEANCI